FQRVQSNILPKRDDLFQCHAAGARASALVRQLAALRGDRVGAQGVVARHPARTRLRMPRRGREAVPEAAVKHPWAGPGATLPSVVVVGTSLGGLKALEVVLSELTADFPLPIAVVQHRSPEAPDSLSLLLQLHCALPVSEANDKERMLGGH